MIVRLWCGLGNSFSNDEWKFLSWRFVQIISLAMIKLLENGIIYLKNKINLIIYVFVEETSTNWMNNMFPVFQKKRYILKYFTDCKYLCKKIGWCGHHKTFFYIMELRCKWLKKKILYQYWNLPFLHCMYHVQIITN